MGRWWQCCELQQLWIEPSYRRRGSATQLVQAFEARAGSTAVPPSTSRHSISRRRVCSNRWATPSPTSKRFTRTASSSTSLSRMTRIRPNHHQNARLTVGPLAREDFDGFIAYFTRVSKADAERMGLAIDRVPSPAQLRSDLEAMIATPVDRLRSFVLAWKAGCVYGTERAIAP